MTTTVPSSRFGWHRLVRAIILGSVCVVCALVIGLNNVHRLRLIINQVAWESVRPPGYSMVVQEVGNDGIWDWAVSVQGGRSTAVKLKSFEFSPGRSSVSSPTVTTIEKAFDLGQRCARFVLDCEVEFDRQYHFPRVIGHSDLYRIEVKEFTPCGASAASCPSAGSSPAK